MDGNLQNSLHVVRRALILAGLPLLLAGIHYGAYGLRLGGAPPPPFDELVATGWKLNELGLPKIRWVAPPPELLRVWMRESVAGTSACCCVPETGVTRISNEPAVAAFRKLIAEYSFQPVPGTLHMAAPAASTADVKYAT